MSLLVGFLVVIFLYYFFRLIFAPILFLMRFPVFWYLVGTFVVLMLIEKYLYIRIPDMFVLLILGFVLYCCIRGAIRFLAKGINR